ncbi:MAG: tRNA (adenosine(37)-N6)-threonylcarbamoyltransferase complex ATPase subunit type 1 TsaE [Pseudohongiellaceae bacterium]|nr:tRNA (adenosine(37)-N6)-threonylcarbamoyltransferase complex ATPase subunit type 1 TsaE [Pseudohongiellaceae bacterium]
MIVKTDTTGAADTALSLYLADEASTEELGKLLAMASSQSTADNEVGPTLGGRLFLSGDLGAGKTTLSRGIVRAYGHHGAVKSPTYTLVEPYELVNGNIYHFDLYRLSEPEEVEFLGVEDYFSPRNLCIIEWAEKGAGFLPRPDLRVTLSIEGEGRRATLGADTKRGHEITQNLLGLCQNRQFGTP